MKEIRYTLVSEGSSDRALLPILNWLLRQHTAGYAIQSEWAELRHLPRPPKELAAKIQMSLNLYPCDVLFVHRDADSPDRSSYNARVTEIQCALSQVDQWDIERSIPVIPVQMTEAWLLFDEAALRRAAGNPNGRQQLEIPPLNRLEQLADPKQVLHQLLKDASELSGRRLKRFPVEARVWRITQFIHDFSLLRALEAFQTLEKNVSQVVRDQGWASH
jgi:hypothetical protein